MEEKEGGCFHEAQFIDENGEVQSTRVPVVQELARGGLDHVPQRFISLSADHPKPVYAIPDDTFPCIDMVKLGARVEPEVRARELGRLASGAKEWGMFILKDHGIPNSVVDDVRDVVKGFFGLSFEEKKASVGCYRSTDNMGYGRNFVKSEDHPMDWVDRLAMVAAPKEPNHGLLVWPRKPPNFRQVMEIYVEEARKVCDELLQKLAEALSLDKNAFIQHFEPTKSEVKIRVNCYPPCPRPDLTLGLPPHTDASALTLLLQFGAVGGLQVLKGTEWMTVPWPVDALLVNVGDLLEIMSNGRLRSPWHQVVTHLESERFSMALFYNPPPTMEIHPIPDEKWNKEEEGYKKVVVEDYLQHFYKISPTTTKQAIMFAMV